MRLLRTPDARFQGLPDFGFKPRFLDVPNSSGGTLRIASIDEGPADQPPVLLMHGEPSWSFLYRHIIARLAKAGHRAVAPDLVGFGRSDKPAEREDYTYERHVKWMSDWLTGSDLREITLFCQDWGGLIGLRLVAAFPDRFARVIVANTGLPTGSGVSDAFRAWVQFSQTVPVFPAGDIVNLGTLRRNLSTEEKAAYDAPYPDESFKSGARTFPMLVPVTPEHASVEQNKNAWKILERFDKPFITAFSDGDAITKGGERIFQERVPGASGQEHVTIKGAGHFLQEDKPDEIADLIDSLMRRSGGR